MTEDEIVEMAINGHASTRDAIRWAMRQEREKAQWDGIHTCNNDCDRPACVAVRKAVIAEREACAKLIEGRLETPNMLGWNAGVMACLKTICARGKT